MKKIFYVFAALLTLAACNKSEDTPELSVSTTSLTFDADGGTQSFAVYGSEDWAITTDGATWYSVIPVSGDGVASVEVTAEPYTESAGRSSVLTITLGTQSVTVTIVQNRREVPSDPSVVSYSVNAQSKVLEIPIPTGYTYTVDLPEGYEITDSDEGVIYVSVPENTTGETVTDEIKILTDDGQTLETISVERDSRKLLPGEILINEIFFTGVLLDDESSDIYDGDQYVVLYNASDYDQCVDGLLFAMGDGSQAASTGAVWVYPTLTDSVAVSTIYAIPENDNVLKAGETTVIALAAQNFKSENGKGCDLSKANFEIYDEDEYASDTDNPDVPNLDTWFKESNTITVLHSRGYESFVIAVAPEGMTAEEFIASYKWNGKRTMDWNGYSFSKDITGYYLLPNDWIIDGVNCAVDENLSTLWINASIDAGYTNVTTTDSDPTRFGKSAQRINHADTDNSTNDFKAISASLL